MNLNDREYTTGEVSKMLGVCKVTIANWCNRGILPHRRLDNTDRRINHGDLLNFLNFYEIPLPNNLIIIQ